MKTIKVKSEEEAKLTKFFPCEIVKETEDTLLVDFTVQKKDRDNEILLVKGARLKHYRENPIIQADHNWSVKATVGSCKWVKLYPSKNPDRIRIEPRWATTPFALDVRSLVEGKHLKTVSHTFYGWEYVDDEESIKELGETFGFNPKGINKVYTDWEPLEVSWVTVPACTDAMVVMAEEGILKTKYFKEIAFGIKSFSSDKDSKHEDRYAKLDEKTMEELYGKKGVTVKELIEALSLIKEGVKRIDTLFGFGDESGQEEDTSSRDQAIKNDDKEICSAVGPLIKEVISEFNQTTQKED